MSRKDIPVFINVFNRVTCLRRLVGRLERAGIGEIVLVDNGSTYPPLLEYLDTVKYRVIRLGKNYGAGAMWEARVLEMVGWDGYYVYTDPDVIPIDECPDDFMMYFRLLLERFEAVGKVGFGLRIDNLPDNELTRKVKEWEKQYWEKEVWDNVYEAYIDTTFSMYRPKGVTGHALGLRTGYPYVAEHTTWYEDFTNLPDELQYYVRQIEPRWSHWFRDEKK